MQHRIQMKIAQFTHKNKNLIPIKKENWPKGKNLDLTEIDTGLQSEGETSNQNKNCDN